MRAVSPICQTEDVGEIRKGHALEFACRVKVILGKGDEDGVNKRIDKENRNENDDRG